MLEKIKFPESKFYVPQTNLSEGEALSQVFEQALAEPIDFPTLDQFVLSGDQVAVVVLGNLPQPVECLAAVVGAISATVKDAKVSAVISPIHAPKFSVEIQEEIVKNNRAVDLQICVHDPDDREMVACIANNQAGEPVYINRTMFDADVVIPVGTLLADDSVLADSFYPEFSSAEVLKRFRDPDSGVSKKQLDGEVRMAHQHLGGEFSILVVRGPGGKISGVRAGNNQSIRSRISNEMNSLWSIESQADGEVVVATIEGNSEQQTWEDVFNALAAAAASSQTVRQVVVCSELDVEPSLEQMEVLQLQFEVDLDVRCRKLGQLSGVHQIIPGLLESTSVNLLSRLSQDCVEEAGLGYIESEEQIQRIVDRAESGILLRDAHLCRVAVGG